MVNVVLDAKQQSFKLCAVDGVDVVISMPNLTFIKGIISNLILPEIVGKHQYHTKIDELIERTSSTMSQGITEDERTT